MKHVAVGIIISGKHVLACQRKHNMRYPLKWEFPGGKLEDDETPEAALIRELREELAIEAIVQQEFHRQEWVYSEGVADPKTDGAFRVFYFLIRSFTGTPVNHAFEQIKWVTPEELEKMDILEGNRKAVELLVSDAKKTQQQTA